MKLFTVHDMASDTNLAPFSMATARDAIEGFKIVVNDKQSPYSKHPADYTLYEIGTYDVRSGELSAYETPKKVNRAIDLIEPSFKLKDE